MRKVWLIVGGLTLLLVAFAIVLPGFLDWNRYRSFIAEQAEAFTGRRLAIDGDIRLTLLPLPLLSANGLRLANAPGFDGPEMASIQALRAHLALGPLLGGELRVERIELVRPVVRLEQRPDGSVNWDLPPPLPAGPDSETAWPELRPSLRIDAVEITDGVVDLRGPRGTLRFERVNGEISPGGAPFAATLAATLDGIPVALTASIGSADRVEPKPVSARLTLGESESAIAFLGQCERCDGADGRVSGSLRVTTPRAAAFVADAARIVGSRPTVLPAALAKPGSIAAMVEARRDAWRLSDLNVVLGDERLMTGTVTVVPGDTVLVRAIGRGGRLDLDAWLAAMPIDVPPPIATQLDVPVRLEIDGAAEIVLFRNGVLRDARIEGTLRQGRLDVTSTSIALPGPAFVSVAGSADLARGSFAGQFETTAENLRGTLDWLGLHTAAIPSDRLRGFSASGEVEADPTAISIEKLDARVDSTHVAGSVAVAAGDRPSVTAVLRADRFNLDAYGLADPEILSAAGSSPFDGDAALRVDQLTVGRVPIRGAVVDGSRRGSAVDLRVIAFEEMAGASATLHGSLDLGGPRPKGVLAIEATSREPARTLRLFAPVTASILDGLGPLRLAGTMTGDIEAARIAATVTADEVPIAIEGRVERIGGPEIRYSGTITAAGGSLTRLVAALAPAHALPRDPGGFAISARVEGDARKLEIASLEATVDAMTLSGTGSARWDGKVPVVTADLDAGDVALDRIVGAAGSEGAKDGERRWSGTPFDFAMLRSVDGRFDAKARSVTLGGYRIGMPDAAIVLREGILEIASLRGRLGDGEMELRAKLTSGDVPAASGQLRIVGGAVPRGLLSLGAVGIAGGALDGRLDFVAAGRTEREMIEALGGTGRLVVRDGTIQGFDLARAAARLRGIADLAAVFDTVASNMADGTTAFDMLDARFAIDEGIVASERLSLTAGEASGDGSIRIDLPTARAILDARFSLAGYPGAPPFGMTLAGPLSHQNRRFETDALQTYLIGEAALHGAASR